MGILLQIRDVPEDVHRTLKARTRDARPRGPVRRSAAGTCRPHRYGPAAGVPRRFRRLHIERHGLPPLTRRVWSLRDWLRVSDGYYVTLAEALRMPVLTTDRRLARILTDRGLVEVVDIDAG